MERFKDNVIIKQYGNGYFIRKEPGEKDVEMVSVDLEEIILIITLGKHDMTIFNEISIAVHFNLLKVEDITELVKLNPEKVETVLTGRKATPEILEIPELVTEMK
ncbi:MAG: cob(I)yrinic acid a,c-diamide adenosyltransferase [Actinobacteria bacterium]|nr:cob(I)yrinic acid a,c-diamide adenosyltransferase [Actinomycetota bacterium]